MTKYIILSFIVGAVVGGVLDFLHTARHSIILRKSEFPLWMQAYKLSRKLSDEQIGELLSGERHTRKKPHKKSPEECDWYHDFKQLALSGDVVSAVKFYRSMTRASLVDAKQSYDQVRYDHFSKKSGIVTSDGLPAEG